MKNLQGKTVVVTGAASGIGRLMALGFADEGANLAVLDIDEAALGEVASEIASKGVKAEAIRCDVSSQDDIDHAVARIADRLGAVDVLVNNAGIAPGRWVHEAKYDQLKKTLEINLLGPMWLTSRFLPSMIERGAGHIVNVASAMGLQAAPRMSDYSATKFGLIGYSDSLRLELKKHGHKNIHVTVVCPSGIDTGMFDGYKPPLLSPLLKPEKVARAVIKAVKKNHTYVKLPFVVKTIPFLKGFPAGFQDRIAAMLGLLESMDDLER